MEIYINEPSAAVLLSLGFGVWTIQRHKKSVIISDYVPRTIDLNVAQFLDIEKAFGINCIDLYNKRSVISQQQQRTWR